MATAQTYWGTSIFHESTGVTYHFAAPVEYGYYWNGDPFVVAGGSDITITEITPEWSGSGRIMHGAMLQPNGTQANGFDNAVTWPETVYVSGQNVDPAATGQNLLISATTYPTGASLVKAVSLVDLAQQQDRSVIDKFSVLTVVPSTPPEDAFRPPVMGTDKTSYYTLDDLDFSKLQSVAPVVGQKPITDFNSLKEATFVSWYSGSESVRYFHPNSYHEGYNDYQLDGTIVPSLMALHSDYTQAEKLDLYAAIVQQGIDYAGFNNTANAWLSQSTHVELFPPIIATAAVALGSPQELLNAMAVPQVENFFYVPSDLVGKEFFSFTSSHIPSFDTYQGVHVGMPEWRVSTVNPDPSLGQVYRGITADNAPITALLMEMLGDGEGREIIQNEAYFDYAERMRLILDVNPGAFWAHGQSPEWTAFIDAYHPIYSAGANVQLRPEAPRGITVTLDGSDIDVSITGDIFPGSSPLTRVDVRYKEGDEGWSVIQDFGVTGSISPLSSGIYMVQARFVNSVGEGPWSSNAFSMNNTTLFKTLLAEGIVSQAEIDAAGGEIPYRKSAAYEQHVRNIWNGDGGYENLTDALITGTVFISETPERPGSSEDDLEPDPIIWTPPEDPTSKDLIDWSRVDDEFLQNDEPKQSAGNSGDAGEGVDGGSEVVAISDLPPMLPQMMENVEQVEDEVVLDDGSDGSDVAWLLAAALVVPLLLAFAG